MGAKEDAYEPFRNIEKRIAEVGESLSLELHKMVFEPGPDNIVQCVFILKPDAVLSPAELQQREMDKEFADIVSFSEDDERMEEMRKATEEDLRKFLAGDND